jgi:glyoxylase-like metal-dependent hydrolase (beta-lactamase superfamily II)
MIELVTTDGIFALDGGEWEVTNNIWLVGDDREVVVIDAAHDHRPIVDAVAGRRVTAIVLTHGHNDHITAARGTALRAGGAELAVLHTPGHSPGCCCFHLAGGAADAGAADVVFSGDTLFCGGPGATGRSFSDFPTIVESIRRRLLGLPPETVVHTGHGESTTIGAEAPHLQEWIDRGH